MHSNCPRDQFWGKVLTWKRSHFNRFRTLSENFLSWKQHVVGGKVKISVYFWRGSFLGITFSEKRCHPHFFRSLSKKLWNARKYFSSGIVKAAFYDSGWTMWVNTFSEIFFQLIVFLGFERKSSATLTKRFRQVCENCIFFVSRGTFSMKIFSIEFTKLYS